MSRVTLEQTHPRGAAPRGGHHLRLQRRAHPLGREGRRAAGRGLVVVGRAMHRVIEAAQETGYLDRDLADSRGDGIREHPPRKVVALCTGSQGEARAAMARIAQDEHPQRHARSGRPRDLLLAHHPGQREGRRRACRTGWPTWASKSSPTMTRRSMSRAIRGAANSSSCMPGSAARSPFRCMARPAPGSACAARRAARRDEVVRARNGDMVRLAAGPPPRSSTTCRSGGFTATALVITRADDGQVRERRKLSFAGVISVSLVLSEQGRAARRPRDRASRPAAVDAEGTPSTTIARDAVSVQSKASRGRAARTTHW